MLTVHHLAMSQSDRIVWLCEELELPYRLVRYERDPVTRLAPPEYRALHPFGTAPAITDGEIVLGESGAIIDYLINRHASGRLAVVPSAVNYPEYLFWFHFANASLLPSTMMDMIVAMIGQDTDVTRTLRERGNTAFAMIESRLSESPYLAGSEFTAADIITLFPLTTGRLFVPRDLGPYPDIRRYLQRIGERPAFQRAMAKADPDLPPHLT